MSPKLCVRPHMSNLRVYTRSPRREVQTVQVHGRTLAIAQVRGHQFRGLSSADAFAPSPRSAAIIKCPMSCERIWPASRQSTDHRRNHFRIRMAHDAAAEPAQRRPASGCPSAGEQCRRAATRSRLPAARSRSMTASGTRSRETILLTRRARDHHVATAELIRHRCRRSAPSAAGSSQYKAARDAHPRPPRMSARTSPRAPRTARSASPELISVVVAPPRPSSELSRSAARDPRASNPRGGAGIRGQQRATRCRRHPMSASPRRPPPGTAVDEHRRRCRVYIGMIGPLSRKTAMVIATRTAAAIARRPCRRSASEDRR